jgi:hypothetical protein
VNPNLPAPEVGPIVKGSKTQNGIFSKTDVTVSIKLQYCVKMISLNKMFGGSS